MSEATREEIYLDSNATTRPLPEVRRAMQLVLGDEFGNPSSAHSGGERARVLLHRARESVAALLDADLDGVVFTANGTEANNLVLASVLERRNPRPRLVTSEVEHSSVLESARALERRGVEVVYIPVDRTGRVDVAHVAEELRHRTTMVSIQWANNETGVVHPIGAIASLCERAGVPFHTDAAQAVGKLTISLEKVPVTFLTLTAHKFHGPQGAGVLWCRDRRWIRPLVFGGPQEHGLRPGTENLPAIVGLGVAAGLRRVRFSEVDERTRELRDRFESQLLGLEGVERNGTDEHRISNTSNLLFRGIDGQALVARLDRAGVRCSQSSACTNQRPEPSYVLRAMGLPEEDAYSSVRFSLGEDTRRDEVDAAAEIVACHVSELRTILGRQWAGSGAR